MITFFTSINNAYLCKAQVMVASLRRHHPDCRVHCALADRRDPKLDYGFFDAVHSVEELSVPVGNLEAWIFSHSAVELCTAIKPFAFKRIFEQFPGDSVIYIDPDTYVLSRFEEGITALHTGEIVLTPHVTRPAKDPIDIQDGEWLGCLHHGVFNLGFLGLAPRANGREFLDWWAARCLEHCYDDKDVFLFTDQKWVDLAPCMFEGIVVLRHPGYNMATWNLYYRHLTVDRDGRYMVNGESPLRFFHFSGFDKGVHDSMAKTHAKPESKVFQLTQSYRDQLDTAQSVDSAVCTFERFSDGERVREAHRIAFRKNPALQAKCANPYLDSTLRETLAGVGSTPNR